MNRIGPFSEWIKVETISTGWGLWHVFLGSCACIYNTLDMAYPFTHTKCSPFSGTHSIVFLHFAHTHHTHKLSVVPHTHTQWPIWRQSTPLPTPPLSHGTNLLTTTECSYMEKQQTTYLSLGSYNWLMWQDRLHTLWKDWTHSETIALVSFWQQTMEMEVMQQW